MANTGARYPASVSSTSSAPYDDNTWSNVTRMSASDASYASVTAYDTNDWTYEARCTAFNAGIPAGATIDGILVEIRGYQANGSNAPKHVQLTKDGSTAAGDEKGSSTNWATSAETRSFGGATDKWGTTWTRDEVVASTFGVLFANQATANDADVYVDFVRVTVYFTVAAGTLLWDSFNRANGSLGTADCGQDWQYTGDKKPAVSSNRLAGSGSGSGYTYIDAGETVLSVSAMVQATGSASGLRQSVVFRAKDGDNWWLSLLYWQGGADYRIYTGVYVAGSLTSYGPDSVSCTANNWYELKAVDNGSTVKIYFDGGLVRSINSTTHNDGTRVGVYCDSSSLYMDDWLVMGEAEPEEVTGTGALSLRPPVLAAAGSETFSGVGAVQASAPAVAASGAETFTGTAALTTRRATVAATGTETFTGTAALSARPASVAATGGETFTGAAALTTRPAAIVATGAETFTGTGAVIARPPVLAAAGGETFTGAGALAGRPPTVAATGSAVAAGIVGSAALALQAAAVAAQGELAFAGSGAVTARAPIVSATGSALLAITGTGAVATPPARVAATGVLAFDGAAAVVAQPPALATSGALAFVGAGALGLAPMAVAGIGALELDIVGAAALVLRPAIVRGLGAVGVLLGTVELSDAVVSMAALADSAVALLALGDRPAAELVLSDRRVAVAALADRARTTVTLEDTVG